MKNLPQSMRSGGIPALLALAMLAAPPAGISQEASGQMLPYRAPATTNLLLEVFFPPGWQATDKRPAVLLFHGGGFTSGSRDQFAFQSRYFASRGLVAATADYRTLDQHGALPHQSIADGREAVRFLKRNALSLGIDPGRLIVGGGSSGAIIAANTAFCTGYDQPGDDTTVSCRPAALLLFNPIFELESRHLAELERNPALKDPQKRKTWLDMLEPLPSVRAQGPPAILFYGRNDPACASGLKFMEQSRVVGNDVACWIAEGQGHGFFNEAPWMQATLIQADCFLCRLGFLNGPPTLPESAVTFTAAHSETGKAR